MCESRMRRHASLLQQAVMMNFAKKQMRERYLLFSEIGAENTKSLPSRGRRGSRGKVLFYACFIIFFF